MSNSSFQYGLADFLSAYFHQDWVDDNLNEQDLLRAFVSENKDDQNIWSIINEAEDLLRKAASKEVMKNKMKEMGVYVLFDRVDANDWLVMVVSTLKVEMARKKAN